MTDTNPLVKPTPLRPTGMLISAANNLIALAEKQTDPAVRDQLLNAIITISTTTNIIQGALLLLARGSTCPVIDADLPDTDTETEPVVK